MNIRKIIKISLITLSGIIVGTSVLFTLLSYLTVKGKVHGSGYQSLNAEEAEKMHTIIAKYYIVKDSININGSSTGLVKDELFLERMHEEEKYKYIYYSPTRFSDQYYINDDVFTGSRLIHRDSTWVKEFDDYQKKIFLVVGGNDTLFDNRGALSPVKSIPHLLNIYLNDINIANYSLGHLYKENLENIPGTPFWARFSRGPLFDDYYN